MATSSLQYSNARSMWLTRRSTVREQRSPSARRTQAAHDTVHDEAVVIRDEAPATHDESPATHDEGPPTHDETPPTHDEIAFTLRIVECHARRQAIALCRDDSNPRRVGLHA